MKKNEVRILDGYKYHYLGELVHYEPSMSTRGWLCKIIKFNDESNGDFIAKKLAPYKIFK